MGAPGGGGGGGAAGGDFSFIIMMTVLFGVFYFLLIRPQQKKKQKERKNRINHNKGGNHMDYNRNKKYFEGQNFKGAIIALIIGGIIFIGGASGGSGAAAVVGLIIAGIGGFLIYSNTAGRPTDSEIDQACLDQVKNLKDLALKKHGLDADQVKEADPIQFDGYFFENIRSGFLYKMGKDNIPRSSNYEAVSFVFSAEQVYCYKYRFSITTDEKSESTEEYFYRDIVSASTQSDTKNYKTKDGKDIPINYQYFKLATSGGSLQASILNMGDAERSINGMKSLLRNKKQQLK